MEAHTHPRERARSTALTVDVLADTSRFLAASRSSQTLERRRVAARPLEAALSVWVEELPPTVDEGVTREAVCRRDVSSEALLLLL